jgi:hypothetical protein
MPLLRIEKPGFLYLAYRMKSFADFVEFKKILEMSVKETKDRDLVVDLSKNYLITEEEVEELWNVLKRFYATGGYLRIIAHKSIKKKLEAMNIPALESIILYENCLLAFNALLEECSRAVHE